ncbi:PEP-CTERM sorting domain-containing protein [Ruficoccus sp. ZRK36]|uniref:PEP-CTERM sorting domain-containing protein n=1 Tax=Ruficoccus sp. ZRK36 TaxID=2866311 RepID=UPI001C738E2C|nr:PEP-CTERM sorting domain-containing protein [Ruficoccus sp. ZRK36]QYY36774.1 PEP-CTERM sorting domain-containing protein [Ruficoccus sp. ZRK36]
MSTDVTSSESISYNYNGIVRGGGNSLVVSSQANEAVARSLAGNASTYTGADYYVSFIFQVNYGTGTGQISNSSYSEDSSFFSVGAGETATQAPNLALGGVIGPRPVARINGTGASGSSVADYNTTYFMVIENVWSETYSAYTQTNVYLYDQTGEVAGLAVSTTNTASTQNSMEKLAMRVFYIGGGTNGGVPYTNDVTLTFDDFLFADSFESATGAIPEPGTYAALAGLAVLGVALLRRKRS